MGKVIDLHEKQRLLRVRAEACKKYLTEQTDEAWEEIVKLVKEEDSSKS